MKTKRNIFIILSFICLILTAIINTSLPQETIEHPQFKIAFDNSKFLHNPYLVQIEILLAGYLIAILLGFFILVKYVVYNLNKPLFEFKKQDKTFPLAQDKSSQLVFSVLFLVLLIYLAQWLTVIFKLKISPIAAVVFFNFLLEAGVIFTILRYVKPAQFDLKVNTGRFLRTAKNYLTILPVLIGVIFINNFVLAKLGIESTINPAIEIFFKIKSLSLLSFFMFQIVFLGPLAEELFFRGIIYRLLRGKYGFLLSAFSSSFLFAILHKSSQDAVPLLVLGIILCYLYEKTKNLITPVLFHVIHNSLNLSFLLLLKNFS
jgi:membrane protease YdiL (CAAX protease family)